MSAGSKPRGGYPVTLSAGQRVRVRRTVTDGIRLASGRFLSAYAGRCGTVTDTYPHGILVCLDGMPRPLPFGRSEVARMGD